MTGYYKKKFHNNHFLRILEVAKVAKIEIILATFLSRTG